MAKNLDANAVIHTGEVKNMPAEALEYEEGTNVFVWASRVKDGKSTEGLVPAIVKTYHKSGDGAFTVCTEDGRTLTYLTAPYASDKHFCFALPHGTCGNTRSHRQWIQLYAITPCTDTYIPKGLRGGWRGLLVGAGARAIGALIATVMELAPDADDSSIEGKGTNGECYWLFAQASGERELRVRVQEALYRCLRSYLILQQHLEAFQSLLLHTEQKHCVLTGPCASALLPPLRLHLPAWCKIEEQSHTQLAGVRREKVCLVGCDLPTARAAVTRSMMQVGLPERLLHDNNNVFAKCCLKSSVWRCTSEGPNARHPGIVHPEAGWSCPANTLAVQGPSAEAVCLVNYARMQGEVPVAIHAEALAPLSFAACNTGNPALAAASTWALNGLNVDQARGSYFGPWEIRDARSKQESEDQDEVLPQWSIRNLKRVLEGKSSSMRPGRYDAVVSLENSPACIEWEDFKDPSGNIILCDVGWCGLENPKEWIKQPAQCKCKMRLTIWPLAGTAFPQAKFREAPVVRLSRKHLYEIEQNVHLQQRLAEVFITSKRHEGLENWNSQKIRKKAPEPLPFCASAHPEPLEIARKVLRLPQPAVQDIEAIERWAGLISDGERPCSLCGTCTSLMNAAIPHLWRIEPQPGRLVCTFPSSWKPRAAMYVHQASATHALPAPPVLTPLMASDEQEGVTSNAEEAMSKIVTWNIPQECKDLVTCLLRRIRSPAAMEGCRHLMIALVKLDRVKKNRSVELDALQDLKRVLPKIQDAKAAEIVGHVFVGAVIERSPQGNELSRTLAQLSMPLKTNKQGWRPWPLNGLLRLAALPCTPSEHKALATILGIVAKAGAQYRMQVKAERDVRTWLGFTNEDLPLLRLSSSLLKPSHRESFIELLEGCCKVPRSDLRCACRLMFAAFRSNASSWNSEDDASAWNSKAITQWASLTIGKEQDPWTHEESIDRLEIVVVSGLLMRRVLELLEEHNVCAKHWDDQLELVLKGPTTRTRSAVSSTPVTLAQRQAEQYEAPTPGEARWYDSHEQPEHQALLLDHTLRELMSLLFHLSLTAERDQGVLVLEDATAVERVLRGDPEYIFLEKRNCLDGKMHVSPETLARQLDLLAQLCLPHMEKLEAELLRDPIRSILFEGSASVNEYSGRCLPRRYLWTH